MSLFYVLEKNLFLQFDWFYFLIYLKSFCEFYLPLYTLLLTLFFNHPFLNKLLAATATAVTPVVSDNGKLQSFSKDLTIFIFFIFVNSLYESYIQLFTLFIIWYFKYLMKNWLFADTVTFHVKGIFGSLLGYWFLQKWETWFEHQSIYFFVKRSEGDLMHTETVFFPS